MFESKFDKYAIMVLTFCFLAIYSVDVSVNTISTCHCQNLSVG